MANAIIRYGYRKASAIFEELEKIEMHNVTLPYGLYLAFAKIKEKYTEEGK